MITDHMPYARDGTYDKHCVIQWEPCACDGNVFPFFRLSRERRCQEAHGTVRSWASQSCCAHKLWSCIGQLVHHDSDSLFIDVVFDREYSLRLRSGCPGSLVRAKRAQIVGEAFDVIWWRMLEQRRRKLEVEKIFSWALSDAASIVASFV